MNDKPSTQKEPTPMMKMLSRNADQQQSVPVDLDRLREEITGGEAPYGAKEPERYTPTQVIAHAITKLTWAEAEAMGDAIKSELVGAANSVAEDKSAKLTAAIQAWAAKWQTFTKADDAESA